MLKNRPDLFVSTVISVVIITVNSISAFTWPIDIGQSSAPITSPFGPRLYNGHYDFHPGIDIRTQNSTTVVAAHNGYADWVGQNGGYNLMVFLGESSYLYSTGYAHLSDTVNLNYPSLYPIFEGDQIAISGGDPPHLHFNYYTRNVDTLYYGYHPHDIDADHPMKILPYFNAGGPEAPTDTWVATGPNSGHITSIQFDVFTDSAELDLNRLELTVLAEEFDADFGTQSNINKNDGTDSTQTTVIQSQYGHGYIDLIITVHDFTVGNNQRMTIKYDFTGFNDGTHQGSVPGDNLYLWLFDVDNYGEYLSGFSADG